VLIGRLSLYGAGATRLHDKIVTVTARWVDPAQRRGPLATYGHDAEAKTLELLEQALQTAGAKGVELPKPVAQKLQDSIARDIEELLPQLESRGTEARAEAEAKLAERGKAEADSIRRILEEQRKRVNAELGRSDEYQLLLGFNEEERRQLASNKRYWQRWLENVDGDLMREPARIIDFYRVASARIEPVGLAYLWPVTG
jgi:hypothetical protein